jgi:hypothetical protein
MKRIWMLPLLLAVIALAGCSKPNEYEEQAIRDLNLLYAAYENKAGQAALNEALNQGAGIRRAR